jgi:poly(A) polymerase
VEPGGESSHSESRAAASERHRRLAEGVIARLRETGHQALLAGGCVRDLLLGRDPLDFDVATSAHASEVQRLFPRTVPVGAQFGVVLVLLDDARIEVATFRSDGRYLDHRHPTQVTFGDARADAERRDFTINGMFRDPQSGEIIDYVGGRADLAAGVIRAIGEPRARFDEDRLRLLRAVRFAARLGYEIEPHTFAAIRELASGITSIAWERIGDEIVKILAGGGAARGFELLERTRLLEAVLPEVARLRGVSQPPDSHPEGDVWVHTVRCLSLLEASGPSEIVALATLLHDVAKPDCHQVQPDGRITFHGHAERGAPLAAEIVQRLRRSRAVSERVDWLVKHHLRHVQAPQMRVSTLKRFLAEPQIDDLLELARIDVLAGSGDLSTVNFCLQKRRELGEEEVRPEPLLRGRDLIELGLCPGPEFRVLLDSAFDAQLEGDIRSPEEARAWARARVHGRSQAQPR